MPGIKGVQKRGETSYFFTVYTSTRGADGRYGRRTKTITVNDPLTPKRLRDHLTYEYAKFKQEVEAGEYITPEKMTFTSFVEEWKQKYAIKQLRHNTMEAYLGHLHNRVIPAFGHLALSDIKTMHIVDLMDELGKTEKLGNSKGTLSPATIQYVLRAVRSVFNRAVEWKLIKSSPADGVKKPKVERKEIDVYSDEEAAKLFKVLKGEASHWRIMITLALTTGLRRGELLGLEWKHIDLEEGTLSVEQSLSTSKGNRYMISEPKTKSSIRKLRLSDPLINELKAYKAHCNQERLLISDLWEEGERYFVFTAMNGKPISPYSVNNYWKKFIEKHNLRYIRFHDLRHTAATWMLNKGMDKGVTIKNVSDILGHADISTTLNLYAHTQEKDKQAAADTFNSLFI